MQSDFRGKPNPNMFTIEMALILLTSLCEEKLAWLAKLFSLQVTGSYFLNLCFYSFLNTDLNVLT